MKGRVFSGIQPTGRLHLGNYLGAMQNYVKLQDDYDCIYCVVDIHALTTLKDTDRLQGNVHEALLDLLAGGLDPQRCILFVQSHVPQVLELHVLLSMTTPLGWLLRVPTFKEKARQQPENVNYGLVGYPVLMTSDIVLYKADSVPVGEDQLPHLELAREIARRFNAIFGETFPEPKAILSQYPRIVGLDGQQKMSKSLNNHIELAASPKETAARVMTAVTDPQRRLRSDPGRPEICNVWALHQHFNPEAVAAIAEECRSAGRGCVDCKRQLADAINRMLAPLRERRAELASKPGLVAEVAADGACRASLIADQTLKEVKEKMGLLSRHPAHG